MNAGTELDRLIAEKVMGWTQVATDGVSSYGTPPEDQLRERDGHGTGEGHFHVPYYSTSIADAWRVVESMAKEGFEPSLDFEGGRWKVCVFEEGYIIAGYAAESAPLAICLCALKAKGVGGG